MTGPDRHWDALDGVRGLAAVAVVLYHANGWLPQGFIGVDVFFVLSGFLITTLLRRERAETGTVRLGAFWIRRARRLYPALVVLCAAVAFLALLSQRHVGAVLAGTAATLGYVANLWELHHDTYLLQHTWTLSIEQQFYAVWPILLLITARPRVRALIIGATIAGALVVALAHLPTLDYPRGAGIVLGCGLAWALDHPPARRVLSALGWPAAVALTALALVPGPIPALTAWPVPLGAVLAVPIIAAAVHAGSFAAVLSRRPLRWLGARSYSLYLWHFPVITVAINNAPSSTPMGIRLLLGIAVSFLLAHLSYVFVEQRWRPIRPTAAVGAT